MINNISKDKYRKLLSSRKKNDKNIEQKIQR
jgi:hypothetical protein